MSESTPVKPAPTQYQRLMRAVYTFFGCGVAGVPLFYMFVFGGSWLAFRSPVMAWLRWPIHHFGNLVEPVARLLMPVMYPNGLPMYPGQMIVFHLVLFFIVGLLVGLPVAIVVYFIPPRSRDGQ